MTIVSKEKINFSHRRKEYATHQPVLFEIVNQTRGPVIEFGCGFGSTEMLHKLCCQSKRKLITLDTDPKWLNSFRGFHETSWHQFILVTNWDEILQNPAINTDWDVVFVDQTPWEARFKTILTLKDKAQYIILHDCDYYPENGIFGRSYCRLNSSKDRGIRTYDDMFRYFKEFFPLDPWPYPKTGPPTLLASNFNPVDILIDYEKY